jgi:hypothetical protein
MLTQTIKSWLHKMFAWWPWKQSTQVEHPHVANPLNTGTSQESVPRPTIDGVAHQAGIAPRLSTIEEWPERVVQPDLPAASEFTETPLLPVSTSPVEISNDSKTPGDEASVGIRSSPSPQQRLEFLHYLVQRGILNEGFEEDK